MSYLVILKQNKGRYKQEEKYPLWISLLLVVVDRSKYRKNCKYFLLKHLLKIVTFALQKTSRLIDNQKHTVKQIKRINMKIILMAAAILAILYFVACEESATGVEGASSGGSTTLPSGSTTTTTTSTSSSTNSDAANTSGISTTTNESTSTTGSETTTYDSSSPKVVTITDWTCAPMQQVGPIKANFSEADIISYFGAGNVKRQNIGLGEGETAPGTIVWPNSKNKLIIKWREGQEYKQIEKIRIDGQGAEWKTKEGIGVGTSLEELVRINGKHFKFFGFDWDYAGLTTDWENGAINKKLAVYLTPSNPEAAFPHLLGDKLFQSNHPKAADANLKVTSLVINF